MKYIITAKGSFDVNDGDGNFEGGSPLKQTESATELIINRLALIHYYKNGIIDLDTTIVTLPERRFLYENIFPNIEVYNSSKTYDDCIDLVTNEKMNEMCKTLPYKPFYQYYERDKEDILNINYNNIILNKELPEFMVCIPRLKKSDTRRNLPQDYWHNFLEISKEKYEKIFVFGKGNENLADDQIVYIDTLQDYCSYIHHNQCKEVVSTISGPCHYVQFFGNTSSKTKMTMIDNHNLIQKHGNDPSYFHPCLNFTNIPIKFIDKLVEPSELLSIITN